MPGILTTLKWLPYVCCLSTGTRVHIRPVVTEVSKGLAYTISETIPFRTSPVFELPGAKCKTKFLSFITHNTTLLPLSHIASSNARQFTSEAVGRRRTLPNEKTKEYLLSIGLDCNRIQKSRPTVLRQDVSTVREHVNLLRGLGMDNNVIANIIYKEASFLRKDANAVLELINYLKNIGLTDDQVANIFQRTPRFFSTQETVIDNIEYMKYLDVPDRNICNMLIYSPSLFFRVQGGVERVSTFLKQVMIDQNFVGDPHRVIRYIMRNDPLLFLRQVPELEDHVRFLMDSGFVGDDLVYVIRYCPSSLRIGKEFLKSRLQYLKDRLSLSPDQVKDLVRRYPPILHASAETIQSHVDLVIELGFSTEDIFRTPRIFQRSLKLIKARYNELMEVGYKPNLSAFIYSNDKHQLTVLKHKLRKRKQTKEKEVQ